jgi:hypothetical protein
MTMVKTTAVAACAIVAAAAGLRAQTRIDLRTQASNVVDFGNATFTRPVRTGAALPAVCQTGELFFKSNAPAGANVYGCVGTNIWAPPAAPATGTDLPDMAGQAGKSLWTDGVSTVWKNITTGATGALALTQTGSEISLDIIPAILPQKAAANVFTGLNTFGFGIQLSPQSAPAVPENGRIWYDSALQKFRCHQNGVTSDCISSGGGGSAQTIVAGTGIVVTDGDGINGNPTITASTDLLNLTTTRAAATALMGPATGGPGAPSFRALTETDLPSGAALLSSANIYNALNRFNAGVQLAPQSAPTAPENGHIWYDSTLQKFRCRQNGVTSDCISNSSARTIVAGTGIVVTDGDGINGNPTITASTDLLNLTTTRAAATALMGPATGGSGVPSFRALTETDLPGGVALLSSANIYNALNRFNAGVQFAPQSAPAAPENGHIWYDSAAGRFRARENGQTVDLRSTSSGAGLEDPASNGIVVRDALNHSVARTLQAANGITITNPDGVAGNPTISGPTASTYAYLSNTFGAAATTGGTIPANDGRGELVTAATNIPITACTVSVTSAVDGAEVRVGIYRTDGTRVCSGTANLVGAAAQAPDIACSGNIAAGSSYYLIAASSSGSITWDNKAPGAANVRVLTSSPAMQPFVTIAGATFDATEAFAKLTSTAAQPLIACHQ